jgi:aminomethyltransferase
VIVSRTGYTGEDGIEAILPGSMVGMAMKMILKDVDVTSPTAVIKPAGLGCRDTLRMEAAMPLYGHELGEDINALGCGIDFAISLDKDTQDRGERFIGQDALQATAAAGGPARKLVGIELDGRRAARQGNAVLSGDKPIGVVTSGCLSPTLGKSIAMAFVDRDLATTGGTLQVDTGRDRLDGKIVPMPFYKAQKA